MLGIRNRPRDVLQTHNPGSSNPELSSDAHQESRSGLVIVIGIIALTSMIFGFILGRLL